MGAFDPVFNGGDPDAFAAKLSPTGSALMYATFLGGNGDEEARGVTVDGSGAAYVTGVTASSDFPTTVGAYDTSLGGASDAFALKLAMGTIYDYSVHLPLVLRNH